MKIFLKNLRYLFKHNLKHNILKPESINDMLDSVKYECGDLEIRRPKILSFDNTIKSLKTHSICRFGDGELQLIQGNDIPFQKSSAEISNKLKEVLSSNHSNIAIAIPRNLYCNLSNLLPLAKNFWRCHGNYFRMIVEQHIDFNQTYYSAEFTMAYGSGKEFFENLRKFWKNKDIAVIWNKKSHETIKYNIFDCANSVEYLYAPSKNAFDEYDKIFLDAQKVTKDKIFIIMLGPTATILAYDLALIGYKAWDLGHIAKSYDYYMSDKKVYDQKTAIEFFND